MIAEHASETLKAGLDALHGLNSVFYSPAFSKAVDLIENCSGRIIVTGIGKSGLIGRKIAATLSSTGTPAIFLHPAEAMHGDLGVTMPEDIFLALSNSGNTEEVIALLPTLKLFGNALISITGNQDSVLAKESESALVYAIKKEGCPLNLAPMASTTATLVLGDCLASVLMKRKNFESRDFARFHPKGSLGRKLLLRVKDLMQENPPMVSASGSIWDAVEVLIASNLGAVLVPGPSGELLGLLSDGDIKRLMKAHENLKTLPVTSAMTRNPVVIQAHEMAEVALRIMQTKERTVTVMPVLDGQKIAGLLRLHDILNAKMR